MVKNLPANAGDLKDECLIPGLGRSPGGGHGNLLQYSFLESPMGRGAWRDTFQRVVKRHDWSDLSHMHKYMSHLNMYESN